MLLPLLWQMLLPLLSILFLADVIANVFVADVIATEADVIAYNDSVLADVIANFCMWQMLLPLRLMLLPIK